jgi:hypothetical protein
MYTEYKSNNSGGRWWLTDDQWKALEKAGWVIAWMTHGCRYVGRDCERNTDGTPKLYPIGELTEQPGVGRADEDGRWLGALATEAYRSGLSMREAVDEWIRITGENPLDAGCPCCGNPHTFTEYDNAGNYVTSGPQTSHVASW